MDYNKDNKTEQNKSVIWIRVHKSIGLINFYQPFRLIPNYWIKESICTKNKGCYIYRQKNWNN